VAGLKGVGENAKFEAPTAEQLAEKGHSCCHSERSEESLCVECQEKERFLVAPLLGMTRLGCSSANCEAVPYKTWRSSTPAAGVTQKNLTMSHAPATTAT
jgi:hypothetical protein